MGKPIVVFWVWVAALWLAGCSSARQQAQYPGFLSDYSQLSYYETNEVAWIDSKFSLSQYARIEIVPVQIWVSPEVQQQYPELAANRLALLDYLSDRLAHYTQQALQTGNSGDQTLQIKLAYLGLAGDAAFDNSYPPLPQLAPPADAQALLMMELEAIDLISGQQQAAAVRLVDMLRKGQKADMATEDWAELDLIVRGFIHQVKTGALFEP